MRLALWTPRAFVSWPARVAPQLARSVELAVITAEPVSRAAVDLDVYHIADDPAHGFVYRALLARPGLVVLEEWNLHRLVFAETAGRADPEAYWREGRRQRGATGGFIARQVLQGRGGALPRLLPLNGRVLDACVALATPSEEVRERAAARLGERPAVLLPLCEASAPVDSIASALVALARAGVRRLPERARLHAEERALEGRPLGRALAELRPRAQELGLRELPVGARARIVRLLTGRDLV